MAPTDAALSAQVVGDERIPQRLRRALNVESGLNDGIATPIVAFMLAVAASDLGVTGHEGSAEVGALVELAIGTTVGVVVGIGSAGLLMFGTKRDWIVPGGRRLATLAAALAAFTCAVALAGNGFIAAFVAGIAFGSRLDRDVVAVDEAVELPELVGEVLTLVVWFVFGAALVPVAVHNVDLPVLVYAVLTLTVLRIGPVALALIRSGLDRPERPVPGVVRSPGPRLDRLRAAGGRGARHVTGGRESGRGGRPDRAAERAAARDLGRSPRQPLRPRGAVRTGAPPGTCPRDVRARSARPAESPRWVAWAPWPRSCSSTTRAG